MKHHINGAELYIAEKGQGAPVILLHGFPLDHRMWQAQAEALSENYRVITPDLRGMGHSDVPTANISIEQYADDILTMMDKMDIQKPHLAASPWADMWLSHFCAKLLNDSRRLFSLIPVQKQTDWRLVRIA